MTKENRVTLSAPTKCYRCGGSLLEGQVVRFEFEPKIDGYIHRHSRSGLCHRRNREVDHLEIMEAIYGIDTQHPAESEAEAAPESEGEARTHSRRLPSVRIHLGNTTSALPTLPEGT